MTAGTWRTSNPNISMTKFQLDKQIPYGALNACGIGLVLSPSAHAGSVNHGDMVLIHRGKRHDANMLLYWRRSCSFLGFLGVDN